MSQKLFPLVKIAETYGSIPKHLKIDSVVYQLFQHLARLVVYKNIGSFCIFIVTEQLPKQLLD